MQESNPGDVCAEANNVDMTPGATARGNCSERWRPDLAVGGCSVRGMGLADAWDVRVSNGLTRRCAAEGALIRE